MTANDWGDKETYCAEKVRVCARLVADAVGVAALTGKLRVVHAPT